MITRIDTLCKIGFPSPNHQRTNQTTTITGPGYSSPMDIETTSSLKSNSSNSLGSSESVGVIWRAEVDANVVIPSWMWIAYLPSVLFEAMLFGLTLYVTIGRMGAREHANDLMMKLFRDGILYFIAVSAAPPQYIALAHNLSLAMVNVAASRLVLNLKVYALRGQDDIQSHSEGIMLGSLPRVIFAAKPDVKSESYLHGPSLSWGNTGTQI
ncbi:hypothetical protein HWV62_7435 [Athelia sp. TMB]|nr:hypothetical protein HWV62_7435 [Athelia sp. TMB]